MLYSGSERQHGKPYWHVTDIVYTPRRMDDSR